MISFGPVTPVLRSFDEAKAREFYLGFLGFELVFEHRFGDNFPLYMGVTRGGIDLHISEHHGDAIPGAGVRIMVNDVRAFASELPGRDYRYTKPGTRHERTDWDTIEFTVTDPFGNRLTFWQEAESTP